MTPSQYENRVAAHFASRGYSVRRTPDTNDHGVDVFAENGTERLAIQAKMYGGTTRSVNRKMIMELHGAKDYFDCDRGILATNGNLLPDAVEAAEKLGIEILHLPASDSDKGNAPAASPFDEIWERHIMPLEGRTLRRQNGKSNKILKVDWGGIERVTSNGEKRHIKIEIFRLAINRILEHGSITRQEINEQYPERASSGIVLILAQVPLFRLDRTKPMSIRLVEG